NPPSVADVYFKIEKLLKRRGDKHLVLQTAQLAIDASRRAHLRTPDIAKYEAHALICGQSWVFQRIGRLPEARIAAEKSLQLGVDIGWERNTAYCTKCLGRLS